jgi:hypothetical protein
MQVTFQNKNKATVLQILNSIKSKYLKDGLQLSYKILNDNPLNNVFLMEIEPEDVAKNIIPKLERFKVSGSNETPIENEKEDKLRELIREVLFKI